MSFCISLASDDSLLSTDFVGVKTNLRDVYDLVEHFVENCKLGMHR